MSTAKMAAFLFRGDELKEECEFYIVLRCNIKADTNGRHLAGDMHQIHFRQWKYFDSNSTETYS